MRWSSALPLRARALGRHVCGRLNAASRAESGRGHVSQQVATTDASGCSAGACGYEFLAFPPTPANETPSPSRAPPPSGARHCASRDRDHGDGRCFCLRACVRSVARHATTARAEPPCAAGGASRKCGRVRDEVGTVEGCGSALVGPRHLSYATRPQTGGVTHMILSFSDMTPHSRTTHYAWVQSCCKDTTAASNNRERTDAALPPVDG
eukprot:scaffold108510_cov44-Tisochrysis_lutea.AAC.5